MNDFVVRAVALALAEVPQANSMWDAKAEEVVSVKSIDVAIAVATDKGLITPIVKAANTKSLKQVCDILTFSALPLESSRKSVHGKSAVLLDSISGVGKSGPRNVVQRRVNDRMALPAGV